MTLDPESFLPQRAARKTLRTQITDTLKDMREVLRDEAATNGLTIWNREIRTDQEVGEEELSEEIWPETWRAWARDKSVWKGTVNTYIEGRRRTHHQSMTRAEHNDK